MLVIWPIWDQISTAKAAVQDSQLLDSYQLAGSKTVLNRDCVVQKRWSCEVVGGQQFSQCDTGLCWGSSAFLNTGTSVKFNASHRALVNLLVLLAPVRDGVLKLCWQGAKIGPFEPRSTVKAASQESQLWDSYQLAGSKMILNRYCAVQKSEAAKL